ncbi:unnamed protein product, partial [Ectocarpus sp. 6 AP-2014]
LQDPAAGHPADHPRHRRARALRRQAGSSVPRCRPVVHWCFGLRSRCLPRDQSSTSRPLLVFVLRCMTAFFPRSSRARAARCCAVHVVQTALLPRSSRRAARNLYSF